jgi:hypothetical protein
VLYTNVDKSVANGRGEGIFVKQPAATELFKTKPRNPPPPTPVITHWENLSVLCRKVLKFFVLR